MRWDQKPYLVERICTCTSRNYECAGNGRGWHVVDGHDTPEAAIRDAADLVTAYGVAYRAVDGATMLPLGDTEGEKS